MQIADVVSVYVTQLNGFSVIKFVHLSFKGIQLVMRGLEHSQHSTTEELKEFCWSMTLPINRVLRTQPAGYE